MSTFTKVLVVLVLVVSGVSLGVVATLFAYRTDYRTALRNEQNARKADVAAKDRDIQLLQDEVGLRESQAAALRQTMGKMQTELASAQTDSKNWQDRYGTLMTEVAKLGQSYTEIANKIGEKDAVIQELTTKLQSAREELAAAESAKGVAEQRAMDLQDRLAAAERNLIELEKSYLAAVKGQ